MRKPNLFIVGQPKSGTSALYEMLKEHPDICMCDEKEPAFLAKDFMEESLKHHGENVYCYSTNLEEYLSLFRYKNEKIIGEGSTHYLYSKVAAREIHDLNPHAKIIIILREPVDFMHALHAQTLSETREDVADFEEALNLEEKRKKGLHIPKRTRCPSYHFYRAQTRYCEQIQRFTEYFPNNQIRIIIFEDFRKDNLKYLKMIMAFLGIDENVPLKQKIINKNKGIRFRGLYHLIQSQKFKQFFRERISTITYFQIKKVTDKIFFKVEKRAQLNEALHLKLKEEFRPMVIELNDYLHKEGFIQQDLFTLWDYKF